MTLEGIDERNGFPFCRNEKNNEFIFENWNDSLERVPFNIKEMSHGIDSF